VSKKPEQILRSNSNNDVYRINAELRDILRNPINLHPQQYELINLAEIDKKIQLLKEKIKKEGQKFSESEQRDLVSCYRLKINHFSSIKNQIAIHEIITDYHTWKRAIKLGYYFDIFKLSQKDIAELKKLFRKVLQSTKTREPGDKKDYPVVIQFVRYVQRGQARLRAPRAALNGLLLNLDREYPPSPFAE